MIVKLLEEALKKALSLEEDEVKRIWQKEHTWWGKDTTQNVATLLKSYTDFAKEGQPDTEDTYKHGLSLLSEDERYELGIIFDYAGLNKKCPILQLTLLGYIDSIVYSLKRHKKLGFPTKYKDYIRRVREHAQAYKTNEPFSMESNLIHVPTHPADYARSLVGVAIPISSINKIFKMYGFESIKTSSSHGKVISKMDLGIKDDHERTLALFEYYLSLPKNSI